MLFETKGIIVLLIVNISFVKTLKSIKQVELGVRKSAIQEFGESALKYTALCDGVLRVFL